MDGVLVDLDVEGCALLTMLPHFFAVRWIDAFDAQIRAGFETGFDGVRVFVFAFVGAIELDAIKVFARNVIDEAAGLSGPKLLAGFGIELEND